MKIWIEFQFLQRKNSYKELWRIEISFKTMAKSWVLHHLEQLSEEWTIKHPGSIQDQMMEKTIHLHQKMKLKTNSRGMKKTNQCGTINHKSSQANSAICPQQAELISNQWLMTMYSSFKISSLLHMAQLKPMKLRSKSWIYTRVWTLQKCPKTSMTIHYP